MFHSSADLSAVDFSARIGPVNLSETFGTIVMRVSGTFGGGLAVTALLLVAFRHI